MGVNTVLTRTSFERVEETAARAEALGAVELQLLRFKPSGRGRLDYLAQRLTPEQGRSLGPTLRRLSEARALAVRIDCALVCFLSADPSIDVEALRRFGVHGCEPGRSLLTVDAHGAARPCSFWAQGGDALEEESWERDPGLARFRDHAAAPPEPCASCAIRAACRGGCKVVAGASGEAFRPDPECPRVISTGA